MFGTEHRVVEVESLRSQRSDQTPAGVSMAAGPDKPPDRFVTIAPSHSAVDQTPRPTSPISSLRDDTRLHAISHVCFDDSSRSCRVDIPRPEGSAQARLVASCIPPHRGIHGSRSRFRVRARPRDNPSSVPLARDVQSVRLAYRANLTLGYWPCGSRRTR
jgi:hypothetical protein